MISPEVRKKIKEIQIKTKRLINSSLIGDSRTAQKGFGFEFDQLREYTQGDDIRLIDWKATARSQNFLVRQYFEERNRTIMILLDCSGSTLFSSGIQRKWDVMAQVASMIALICEYSKDRVGLVLFSDKINMVVPPAKGAYHVRRIMEKIFSYQPDDSATNLKSAFDWIAKKRQRSMVSIVLSDFIDHGYEKSLAIAAKKSEMVAIRCLDPLEKEMPAVGLLPTIGFESGAFLSLNIAGSKGSLNALLHERLLAQNNLFKQRSLDYFDITAGQPWMRESINFFKRRIRYY
ncbi:MAG: DUF58 domain-containing protein [Candidatus Babeliales bacterium]